MTHARLRALEAACLLMVAAVLRRAVPMHRWAPWLLGGARAAEGPAAADAPVTIADERVRRAVHSAARRLPVALTCLDEAVAGAVMLRRRGYDPAVVVGMPARRRGESHAWLLGACGAVVLGGDVRRHYAPVTVFSRSGQRRG